MYTLFEIPHLKKTRFFNTHHMFNGKQFVIGINIKKEIMESSMLLVLNIIILP